MDKKQAGSNSSLFFSLWPPRNALHVSLETLLHCKALGPLAVVGGGESIFALHQIGWYS